MRFDVGRQRLRPGSLSRRYVTVVGQLMNELAAQGKAILMISSELPETM